MPADRSRHRLLLLAVGGTLLAGTLAPSAALAHRHRPRPRHAQVASLGPCADADTAATAADTAALQAAVVCLTNRERARFGLPALHQAPRLTRSAQAWTSQMVSSGVFSHGADFASRISATGYDWSLAGENIASGFTTPSAVVQGWMASPGHCRNILNPGFADLGAGVSPSPTGLAIGQGGTWTQDFGLWMGHQAPSSRSAAMNGCPYGSSPGTIEL